MNIVDKILVDPITRGLKFFTKGGVVVSQSPVGMSDQLATQLGLKQYLHGTTYNGGIAPTITGGALSSVIRGTFVPYQMQDGRWRLRFNMALQTSAISRTSAVFSINGIVTSNPANFYQTFPVTDTNISMIGYLNGGINSLTIIHASSATTLYCMASDLELDSKPTWAY